MLLWVCSLIDHGGRRNVVKTSVAHSPAAHVPLLCLYHILTSSVIYYWTDAQQHGIYLLRVHEPYLKFWFQTDLGRKDSTGFYMLLTFITIVTRWSHSTFNFMLWLVKIWQVSLCGKFMQHLETCLPIAEAERDLGRHLFMFLTVFFHWIYEMKYSCYQESSVIHGWFVYCAFAWEMHRLSKSLEIWFRMASFSKMSLLTCPCLRRKRVEKSQAILEHLMTFRSSISTGKPEQLLSLMCFFFRFPEVERMVYAA